MVELLGEVIGLLKEDDSRNSASIEYDFEEPFLEVLVDIRSSKSLSSWSPTQIDAMQDCVFEIGTPKAAEY
jgi:hypothetical protein